jgi:polyisoprenoid-binding protein YceI
MKSYKTIFLLSMMIVGITVLNQCKKDTETVTNTVTVHDTTYVNVHDTAYGKSISGSATYLDYSGVVTPAKGAVISLYLGTSATGNVVASAFADASGNYVLPYLLPNSYFVYAEYNTDNNNARVIDGINFQTNPGYAVVLDNENKTQNLSLVNIQATGTTKIAMDTITANQTFRQVSFETHSKLGFNFQDHAVQTTIGGGFNVFAMEKFVFDEANPSNIVIQGYTLLSQITTYEPARDDLASGCVHKTLNNDTATISGILTALPLTDTARFVSNSIVKYGDGYLCHGTLTAFYKHGFSDAPYLPDTVGGFTGPFDQMISKPVDLYFNFDKQKVYSGAYFNWWFVFEGKFSFKPLQDFYISSSHIGTGILNVDTHVQFKGPNNVEY